MPVYDNVPTYPIYGDCSPGSLERTITSLYDRVQPVNSVLDVGTGHGGVLAKAYWDNQSLHRVACDIDIVRPSEKWEVHNHVDVVKLSEYFGPKTFDVVTCFEALEHVLDSRKALEELCLVARKLVVISSADEGHHAGPEYERICEINPACRYIEQPKISDLLELGFETYVEHHERRQIFAWRFL